MKRLALAVLLAGPLAACGQPAPSAAAPPEIARPWTRDTVGGTASAAVFMTVTAPAADRLVAASTPVAAKTDLMTMTHDAGGAMTMAYVEGIDLPAGQAVSLDATGLHVWLADLTHPLEAGETFPLTLEFEHAGKREVTVAVIAPAAPPPMAGMTM